MKSAAPAAASRKRGSARTRPASARARMARPFHATRTLSSRPGRTLAARRAKSRSRASVAATGSSAAGSGVQSTFTPSQLPSGEAPK